MKTRQTIWLLVFCVALVDFARSEITSDELPKVYLTFKSIEVRPKGLRSFVTIHLLMEAEIAKPFWVDPEGLVGVFYQTSFKDTNGFVYQLEPPDTIHGSSSNHFEGDFVMVPKKSNDVSLQFTTDAGGFVLVNRRLIRDDAKVGSPGRLHCGVSTLFYSTSRTNAYKFVKLVGVGFPEVSWRKGK